MCVHVCVHVEARRSAGAGIIGSGGASPPWVLGIESEPSTRAVSALKY